MERGDGEKGVDAVTPPGFYDGHLHVGLSIYWSQLAMAQGAGDASKAEVIHWLWDMHKGPNQSVVMASKRPLESRVWHSYPGQQGIRSLGSLAKPTGTARILEGGATQLVQNEYNQRGMACKMIDPSGRETRYTYGTNNVADPVCSTGTGLDLLKIEQKNGGTYDTLASYTYNTMHQALTVTDAAGQTTTYTYNSAGQVLTVTTPPRAGITENRTTTYSYDNDGYLLSVTGPAPGAVTTYTYDGLAA